MCLKSLATDVFLRTLIFTDMNFSEPFHTIALGLLSYLGVRIINQMIFVNLVNFDRFDENQYLRNFPFKAHLQKLIPAKKFVRIHLPKLMRDYSFKFTFTGFYSWIFSNDKKQCVYSLK